MTKLATRSEKLSNVLAWEFAPEEGYCRSTATVTVEAGMDVGAVVVRSLSGATGTYAADAGNTGNFTASAVTVTDPAEIGNYRIVFTAATTFNLYAPDGSFAVAGVLGTAVNAEASHGLVFTLTAGATPAVAGDSATIAVAGTVKYVWVEQADVATLSNDVRVVIDVETNIKTAGDASLTLLGAAVPSTPAFVNKAGLKFKNTLSADEINTVVAKLNARGIRTTVRV